MRSGTPSKKPNSVGLFAGVDQAIHSVFGLESGKHLRQISTARKIACNPVRSADLVSLVRKTFELVQKSFELASANRGDRKPSRENWRWECRTDISPKSDSAEVILERAVAILTKQKHLQGWCNQIPVASGLINENVNKRSAVDLAKITDVRLDLYELKVKSDNPVFAAFEILQYGLAYLLCRVERRKLGYADYHTMKVDELGLNVLAPCSYYKGFDLAWLQAGLDAGIRAVSDEQPDLGLRASFRFLTLPETVPFFLSGAEAIAACGVASLDAPEARGLVHAMSNLAPVYPLTGSA